METIKRLKSKSPKYFKKVKGYCFIIGTILMIIGSSIFELNITLSTIITTIGGTILTVGSFLASLPVEKINDLK